MSMNPKEALNHLRQSSSLLHPCDCSECDKAFDILNKLIEECKPLMQVQDPLEDRVKRLEKEVGILIAALQTYANNAVHAGQFLPERDAGLRAVIDELDYERSKK